MTKTLHATFDGKVFRPERPIRLKRNASYIITIERQEKLSNKKDSWDILSNSVGKIEGPSDWSKEHDHYLYGNPKK